MGKVHTFVVHLRRESRELGWGLRLVGGSDLATPLIITRVNQGTPAARELIRGDIIAKVDDYDARDLRHEDAQNLFRNAGNHIKLVVHRDASRANSSLGEASLGTRSPLPAPYIPVPGSQYRNQSPLPSSLPYRGNPVDSLPQSQHLSPHQKYQSPQQQYHSPPQQYQPPQQQYHSPPQQYQPPPQQYHSPQNVAYPPPGLLSPRSVRSEGDDEAIGNQPYRTTPLVLPGAKVKRESGPTESYLRHHPNPAMRAPPHHDYRDILMKQKVAESVLHRVVGDDAGNKVVHKQFNSPIGLYSDNNIVNTIKTHTNSVPYKTTVLYDPAKSETYKALQEDNLGDTVQEVAVPVQPKVFKAPTNKVPPTKRPVPPQQQQTTTKQNTFVSTLSEESIQQSNSFKRLMYHVLGETDY